MNEKVVYLRDYKQPFIETRTPWNGFPPVFSFAKLGAAKDHKNYDLAKSGEDIDAATQLVEDLISLEAYDNFLAWLGDDRSFELVPVYAIEAGGVNVLPLAMAGVLSERLGVPICTEIIQSVKAFRTGKGAYYRLTNYPQFDGEVVAGQKYLILDDTLSMGGTIASLKGYIENAEGVVVGAAVLTSFQEEANISIAKKMYDALLQKHGEKLDEWWKSYVGFGLDKLTQGEAGHLKKAPDLESIRERIAESQSEA